MSKIRECCGWLGWAEMAGIDEHGRRIVQAIDDGPETTGQHERSHRAANDDRCSAGELDCTLTVKAVLARYPATAAVFDRFGVGLCCSASLSVEDAARVLGIDAHDLCGALEAAAVAG